MPNTIKPTLAEDVEALLELAPDADAKRCLQGIAATLKEISGEPGERSNHPDTPLAVSDSEKIHRR